jgi:nickel/cobalt exporter
VVFAEHDHWGTATITAASTSPIPGYQDAHERAHANDIKKRFAGRDVTTGQIVLFGLTGGLIPCPAAITVLLLCLQLKQIALGATLVLCFSIGLAASPWSPSGSWPPWACVMPRSAFGSAFSTFARRAPYASGALITIVGLVWRPRPWARS